MSDAVTADDPRYKELFDVRTEALQGGYILEDDMNQHFHRLRSEAPVQKGYLRELLDIPEHHKKFATPRAGYTALSFEACNTAFRDNETFSSRLYEDMPGVQAGFGGKTILQMVGPEHRRYRATLQPMFLKPKAFSWWRERWIDDIVRNLIQSLKDQERADLNLQFCARMPVHTVTRGVGLEGEDALAFRTALQTMMGQGGPTPEAAMQASKTIDDLLGATVRRRRETPGDDVISGLIATELEQEDGSRRPLTDQEIMSNCRLIILAGGGTTWRQLGITLWALLSRPQQLEALRADRGLMEAAIDEAARWNPTDPYFSRLVTCDTVLDGVEVPAGVVLDICLGAANRDPARWDNADDYDLLRPFQSHLGFSIGPHQCLGMNGAKAEMVVSLNAFLDEFPNLRLDPDAPAPQLVGALEGRGMTAVPVRLR
ncbi:cytochrome P450 [Phenylobacterium sp. LjRoot219]|uniref:cytochrome P450 n=1 Tax=Phenylobacterium sp. LjRoot219 TaxID=3342283 RepID=UPI003ECD011B